MFTPLLKTTSSSLQAPKLEGDVGFDLPSSEGMHIGPGQFRTIHTGIHVELPPHHWGLIIPKSSANINGLLVTTGVIDQGYRGELLAIVHNLGPGAVTLRSGQAVAQLVVLPMAVPKLVRVEGLSDSERGENGFGSTSSTVVRKIAGYCPTCRNHFTTDARSYPPGVETPQCPSCHMYGQRVV